MNIGDSDFKDINDLVTQYKKQLDIKVKETTDYSKQGAKWVLNNFLREVEPQKFEGIDIANPKNSDEKYAAARKEFADQLAADIANDTRPGWGFVDEDAELAEFDRQIAKSWYPAAERGEPSPGTWVPANEFPSSSTKSSLPPPYNSPGYAPPDFNDQMLKEYWTKLTNEEQNQILALPEEQQEEATRNLIINRSQAPFKMPNYGSDGELNAIFAELPRLEQIELLKLSHQRQIDKLMEMAKKEKSSDDFSKLRITIPQNKTSSEELYGSPELQMLAPAPANTPATEEKSSDSDKKDVNIKSGGDSNIKKVSF